VAASVIRIRRQPRGYRDSIRAYKVHIDGQAVGAVRRGQAQDFPVVPGVHGVHLTVDWCGSPSYSVRLGEAEVAEFVCWPGHVWDMWQMFLDVNNYIRLVPASPGTQAERM
jgi:hypothetical protein